MRYRNILCIFILFASYMIVSVATADTRYVVDELVITLRQGKSTEHRIVKTLKTGTPLEVLEKDDKSYLKVKTKDGAEGYVLRQYVSANIPKKQRIEELEMRNSSQQKKIDALEAAKSTLAMQLKTIQEEHNQKFSEINAKAADLEQSLEMTSLNERTMAEKYDTLAAQAENVVEIAAERDQLLQKNKGMETEIAALLEKKEQLADSRMIKWFLAGGGVFLFGWIIGKISRKKRSRF